MPKTWTGVLARIGTPTGDGRIIAPGALDTRALPLPLMWQRVSGDGHSGAVTVGTIETIAIDNENGMVTGSGRWLDVRGAADAERQAEAGVTGPSVDLSDDIDIIEAQKLVKAGVVGPDVTRNMDDVEYQMNDDGIVVITRARLAGATLVQIPAFAEVSIDMADGLDVLPLSEGEGPRVAQYADADCFFASAAPVQLPPREWFQRPDLDRLTPVTRSDTGRVFGHIAGWESCHVGLPGCVTPPASLTGYQFFHQAVQPTQEGDMLPVGTLVAGPRHADPQAMFHAAIQHYDDPSAAVARVVAGEDEHGIWVAGWMLPDASEQARRTFMSSPVSGDWRRVAGNLELIAVCSVNSAGFPIPRARVAFSAGAQRTLIGTFGITPQAAERLVQANAAGQIAVDEEVVPMSAPRDPRAAWAWAEMEG